MILLHFFDISTGFRYKKNGKEFSVHLQRRPWIDPQAVNEGKDTAKDIAKTRRKTNVVDFLDKVDAKGDLFPLKEVSPLNFFAITNDSDGLNKHISAENQTANYDANQEVITYVSFILQ